MPARSPYRLLIVAGLAVVAASVGAGLTAAIDGDLAGLYARTLVGPSPTQGVVVVELDAGQAQTLASSEPAGAAQRRVLAAAIDAGEPRLVIWPAVDGAQGSRPEDAGYLRDDVALAEAARASAIGVDPLGGPIVLRAHNPDFPAAPLRSLGLPARTEPLPARYVMGLPIVSAERVAAGEIPAGTFRDRVVIVGRNDPAAATVETPLGPMSPALVEAHALLGVLDGAAWVTVPAWSRLVALVLWALGLARLMRSRSSRKIVAVMLAACVAALAIDAVLFDLGLVRLGASAAILVALTVGAARLVGRLGRTLAPRGLLARTDDVFASTTSGMRKVSDA